MIRRRRGIRLVSYLVVFVDNNLIISDVMFAVASDCVHELVAATVQIRDKRRG